MVDYGDFYYARKRIKQRWALWGLHHKDPRRELGGLKPAVDGGGPPHFSFYWSLCVTSGWRNAYRLRRKAGKMIVNRNAEILFRSLLK